VNGVPNLGQDNQLEFALKIKKNKLSTEFMQTQGDGLQ
jgi:hypothetical protein